MPKGGRAAEEEEDGAAEAEGRGGKGRSAATAGRPEDAATAVAAAACCAKGAASAAADSAAMALGLWVDQKVGATERGGTRGATGGGGGGASGRSIFCRVLPIHPILHVSWVRRAASCFLRLVSWVPLSLRELPSTRRNSAIRPSCAQVRRRSLAPLSLPLPSAASHPFPSPHARSFAKHGLSKEQPLSRSDKSRETDATGKRHTQQTQHGGRRQLTSIGAAAPLPVPSLVRLGGDVPVGRRAGSSSRAEQSRAEQRAPGRAATDEWGSNSRCETRKAGSAP
jgi:hypothetical protein